ncbi:hypothetical protein D9M72_363550 [compost metagenome]
MVDVGDVKSVPVQRADGRTLVDVDVLDAEFAALLEIPVGPGVRELVPTGFTVPLGGVELHPFEAHLFVIGPQPVKACLTIAGVITMVVRELARIRRGKSVRLLHLCESVFVERAEIGRLKDRVVDVAVLEQILHEAFAALVKEFLVGPLFRVGREVAVVVVEAIDELLTRDIPLVFRAGVPQCDVGVDNEVVFAVFAVHVRSPSGDCRSRDIIETRRVEQLSTCGACLNLRLPPRGGRVISSILE